jgi:hypothetical protein
MCKKENDMNKYMTVKELRIKLFSMKLSDDAPVILSSDEEGNEFGVLGKMEKDDLGNLILWPVSGTVEME